MPRLLIANGPFAGRTFDVERDRLIGRSEADIVVDDSEVSRRHAVVRPVPGGIEVEDLGSLNGTWVDEVRIEGAVTLAHAGAMRVGETVFRVEAPPDAREREATPAVQLAPVPAELVAVAPAAPLVQAQGSPPSVPPAASAFTTAHPARRSPSAATRHWAPTVLSFGAVILTAIALVVYFAAR